MRTSRSFEHLSLVLLLLGMAISFPVQADEKEGMPDLAQLEQTCLPTSTSNLMIWFGKHGYPKLIASGENQDDQYQHTVHLVMNSTGARYDFGTKMEGVTDGIQKFVKEMGYDCTVEYRGIDGKGKPFSREWLQNNNDDPNKGFILILGYCRYIQNEDAYTPAIGASHAVTLVNCEPDMVLIHDPAHENDETGRKIVMTQVLTHGTFRDSEETVPLNGLMLMNGSLLDGPYGSQVILIGALGITMHPPGAPVPKGPSVPGPDGVIATGDSTTPASTTPATTDTSSSSSWMAWFYAFLFGK